MQEYHILKKPLNLQEYWQNYVSTNKHAKSFLTDKQNCYLLVASIEKFADIYESQKLDKTAGAKFSERVFSYWTIKELLKNNVSLSVKIHDNIQISIGDDSITKKIDFSFQKNCGSRVYYIEFKCNIDMIEKDLYKFYLMKCYNSNHNFVTSMFIWERSDSRSYARGGLSQYALLLKDAKTNGFLDEYFFFPIYDRKEECILNERIEQEIEKFNYFLHSSIVS